MGTDKQHYLCRKWVKISQKIRSFPYCLSYWMDCIRIRRLRRQFRGIQLKVVELLHIVRAIRRFERCRLLVFGLGNDSPFWHRVNRDGRNVFLEDYRHWFNKITGKYPMLESYLVTYPTRITEWREVINRPEKLSMELPREVSGEKWDVILVDGPQGNVHSEEQPGRLSSIFMASRLVGPGGYVFVHDAEREIEDTYAAKYLGAENMVAKVRGRALMKVFHIPARP